MEVLVFTINLFVAKFPILYPLKTPENLWFLVFSGGYKMGTLVRDGLTNIFVIDTFCWKYE